MRGWGEEHVNFFGGGHRARSHAHSFCTCPEIAAASISSCSSSYCSDDFQGSFSILKQLGSEIGIERRKASPEVDIEKGVGGLY